ncbi:tetratricopeptide repeat protein [Pontibacter sp. G13]|uniref:tetratricopeptide repeat protein n=1 Tax=Pontibacter sp. G13 TaxID=3074898 RepID=UPI0028895F33|nr:tetratricopeptide repeat protein [Pontibacter sp. G13]WNJ21387.1 tetratricopeptide repeat protein [Pontibacter sp. G13]
MIRRLLVFSLVMVGFFAVQGQPNPEAQLAEQYYLDGEYESSLELFTKLNRQDPQDTYAKRIVSCFEQMGDFENAIKFLDKTAKKQSKDPIYLIMKASILEKTGDLKQADKLYEEVITKKLRGEGDFIQIGAYLYQEGKLDLAKQTYLQGRKFIRDPYVFANEIANIHAQLGEYEEATKEYLNIYYGNPADLNTADISILNMLSPTSIESIEKTLLSELDKNQNDLGLRTITYEFYVLAENFYEAFIQVKSIDRLFKEDGDRVFKFAETMRNNGEYELSNKAYDYIIDRKKGSQFYFKAHFEKAINGELKAFEQIPVDVVAVQQAVMDYGTLLDEFGRKPQYFNAIYRRSKLRVFYLNELQEARQELEDVVRQRQSLRLEDWAKGKLLIGDILLMQQEYNKAKLTYTEVKETFKDRQLGALANYKLGQMAYYKGEFNLATALLAAIKDNTSNDISNDAIKLNLLIIDNTGLDTTTTALEMFAQAQLFTYQRKYDESVAMLDSLMEKFPSHSLADEILWEKANIYLKKNDIQTALAYIDRILENFSTDIYGDDALYTKARIYDYTLQDPEQAMMLYLNFLTQFPGSLYSVEVRKRIRELRQG